MESTINPKQARGESVRFLLPASLRLLFPPAVASFKTDIIKVRQYAVLAESKKYSPFRSFGSVYYYFFERNAFLQSLRYVPLLLQRSRVVSLARTSSLPCALSFAALSKTTPALYFDVRSFSRVTCRLSVRTPSRSGASWPMPV